MVILYKENDKENDKQKEFQMRKPKEFTIETTRYRSYGEDSVRTETGTLEYFIDYFGYTLEVGKSWEREKGNKKINIKPKGIKSLITNINNAVNNAAANGYSTTSYRLIEE